MKGRIHKVPRKGWIAAGIWCALYIAFIIWLAWDDAKSLGWLVLLPVIADAFTTKYINWSWWRKYKPVESQKSKEKSQGNAFLYTLC